MLPDSVIIKLDSLRKRRDEIEMLLSQEDATNDINSFNFLRKSLPAVTAIGFIFFERLRAQPFPNFLFKLGRPFVSLKLLPKVALSSIFAILFKTRALFFWGLLSLRWRQPFKSSSSYFILTAQCGRAWHEVRRFGRLCPASIKCKEEDLNDLIQSSM